jgi:hypothetical protein
LLLMVTELVYSLLVFASVDSWSVYVVHLWGLFLLCGAFLPVCLVWQ